MRACDDNLKDFITWKFGTLVSIVRQVMWHIISQFLMCIFECCLIFVKLLYAKWVWHCSLIPNFVTLVRSVRVYHESCTNLHVSIRASRGGL